MKTFKTSSGLIQSETKDNYTIELERDGTWSVFHKTHHYIRGGFNSFGDAAVYVNFHRCEVRGS